MQLTQFWNAPLLYLGCLILVIGLQACNDPSEVGSELIGQDGFEVIFSDSATLVATIISGEDSIQTNGEDVITTDLFLGELDDPYFGQKKFEAYFQASIGSVAPSFYDYNLDDFSNIDSIVLIIRMDTSFFYGDRNASHDIQVFEITEDVDEEMELYTKDDLEISMDPISEVQTIVAKFEEFTEFFDGDSSSTGPSLRIKLNNDFGQKIINDTTAVKKDTSFLNFLQGMMITSTPNNSSVINLDMAVTELSEVGNKMLLYYSDSDVDNPAKVYSFPLGGLRHHHVQKDITGSTLEAALNNGTFSDSIMLAEGFGTADIEIELPYATFANYGNVLINKAELEVTIADLDMDDSNLSQMALMGIDVLDDSGERGLIADAVLAESEGQLTTLFGGGIQEELDDNGAVIRRYYTFNITSYFIDLISNNTIETNKIYLGALVPRLTPGRGTYYGPGNTTFPMKLKVTYTVPN